MPKTTRSRICCVWQLKHWERNTLCCTSASNAYTIIQHPQIATVQRSINGSSTTFKKFLDDLVAQLQTKEQNVRENLDGRSLWWNEEGVSGIGKRGLREPGDANMNESGSICVTMRRIKRTEQSPARDLSFRVYHGVSNAPCVFYVCMYIWLFPTHDVTCHSKMRQADIW